MPPNGDAQAATVAASETGAALVELPTMTLAEVARHRSRDSLWMVVHNRVYDVTEFASTHPGGDIIMLGAGLDATLLFESYHVRGVPDKMLARYCIGRLAAPLPSYYTWPSAFYSTLKKRVTARLKELGRPRRGGAEMFAKSASILSVLGASYWGAFVRFGWGSLPLALGLAAVHGAAAAFVGTSIMHDANHGAYSTNRLLTKLASMGLDLIGASGNVWELQHNLSHHLYTNLETDADAHADAGTALVGDVATKTDHALALEQENDVDVFSSFPLVRMHPRDKRKWFHRFQHLYAPPLFAVFTMSKVFYNDWQFLLQGNVFQVKGEVRFRDRWEVARFLGFKAFNLGYSLALPIWLHGWRAASLLLTAHAVCGEILAIMFISNHISELAEFYEGGEGRGGDGLAHGGAGTDKDPLAHDWAALQCRATVNWGTDPRWAWFSSTISGGLNFQIEHHLLPGVCHTNYRFIAPVVEETCTEFGVPYQKVPGLFTAFRHCLVYLRMLGQEDRPETGPHKNPALRAGMPEEEHIAKKKEKKNA